MTRRRAQGPRDAGTSAVEYGLIVALVVLISAISIIFLRQALTAYFNRQGTQIADSHTGTGGNSIPGTPTGLSAVNGNGQATVSWTPVGGATGYLVTCNGTTTATTSPSFTCTGLSNGTAYTVVVVSTGTGSNSAPATIGVTPHLPAPTGVTVGSIGASTATITWTAVPNATGYTVTPSGGSGSCSVSGTTATCTGLTPATSYSFAVVATSANDTSSPSSVSGSTTDIVPGTPTGLTIAPVVGVSPYTTAKVAVDFAPPAANGGSPVTGYVVTTSPSAGSCTYDVANTTASCTGLTSGTIYTFTVAAINTKGTGTASAGVTAIAPFTSAATVAKKATTVYSTLTVPTGYTYSSCTAPSGSCTQSSTKPSFTAPNSSGTYTVSYVYKKSGSPDLTVYYVVTVP